MFTMVDREEGHCLRAAAVISQSNFGIQVMSTRTLVYFLAMTTQFSLFASSHQVLPEAHFLAIY